MNTLSIFTLLLVTSVQKFLSLRTHRGFLRHFIHLSKSQSGIITAPPKDSLECFREIHPCSSTHGPDSGTPISTGCLPYDRVSSSRTRTGSHFLPHRHRQQSHLIDTDWRDVPVWDLWTASTLKMWQVRAPLTSAHYTLSKHPKFLHYRNQHFVINI